MQTPELNNSRVENWTPPKQQQEAAPVPKATHVPEPDPRAKAWVEKNSWFNEDRGMQSYAILVHEELVENGLIQVLIYTTIRLMLLYVSGIQIGLMTRPLR
jgi:hypothetical protein